MKILGDRESEFIKQMRINYDLIEVIGEWCFSISQRKFVSNPIKESEWEHTKEPDPGYFKEIFGNSALLRIFHLSVQLPH